MGPNALLGHGTTGSNGQGQTTGSGSGEGGGPLAAFGVPGGGSGIGPRTKFFGVGGRARRIVFVLDASGSMLGQFDFLRLQLNRALDVIQPPQSFNILFFNEDNPPAASPDLMFATPDNKRAAKTYVERQEPHGATEPLGALSKAFAMKPDLIYFLIDPTDFPDRDAVLRLVHKYDADAKIKMNIIAFPHILEKDSPPPDPEVMKFVSQLAKQTGGRADYIDYEKAKQLQ
jgi:hypothetical protein